MKKLTTLIVGLISFLTFAQPPQGFNYQAALRNAEGGILSNQSVEVIITLTNADGSTEFYKESHTANTGANGVISLPVGFGNILSGSFSDIPWSQAEVFVKTEVRLQGQNQFIDLGRSRLLSVPIALYAASGNPGPQGEPGPQGIPGTPGVDGRTILHGNTDPTNEGADGDFYINTATNMLFGPKSGDVWPAGVSLVGPQGAQGSQGPQGQQGPAGVDGRTVLNGTVNPSNTIGQNGDFYINTATNMLFGPKSGGVWPAGVSLVGPQGAQGSQGPQGQQGPAGVDGRTVLNGTVNPSNTIGQNGDFYINTATNMLFGPKSEDVWPAGVSLVGPQGLQGPQGPQGPAGIGLTNRGAWHQDSIYVPGDYVFSESTTGGTNSMWIAQAESGPTTVMPKDNSAAWVEFQAPQGEQGPQGLQGPAGTDGRTVLNGTVNPSNAIGQNGDFYINTATNMLFGPKSGGVWPAGVSLVGPQGAQGPQGLQGPAGADGRTVLNGTVNPNNAIGQNGDFYINTVTNMLFGPKSGGVWPAGVSLVGPQGAQGSQGLQGTAGADGRTVLNGTVNPSNAIGQNGDFYINTVTNMLFGPKSGGVWPTGVSLVGPQGLQGTAGADGRTVLNGNVNPSNAIGQNGDFYINTATNMLLGPKSGGVWPAGVSLVGPQGAQGPQGLQGTAGADGRTVLNGNVNPSNAIGQNGDFYINTATNMLFGPKSGDVWPAGVSLIGPQGISIEWLGTFSSAPANPSLNQAYYNSTLKQSFIYDGSAWKVIAKDGADAVAAVTGTGTAGKIALWNSPSSLTNLESLDLNPNVAVNSNPTAGDEDPIFEVKNKTGQVVFAVYQQGVRVYVSDDGAKAPKGGFAVGGIGNGKGNDTLYMKVTPDSVKILFKENASKSAKGGFLVGGLSSGKGNYDLLRVSSDSTRIYVSENTKGPKGGFAVGGLSTGKSSAQNFMLITPENYLIGQGAGDSLTTGKYNSLMGYMAGARAKGGSKNIFIGHQSGESNVNGNENIFIGFAAGRNGNIGNWNTFLGLEAGLSNTGSDNTFIGYKAGRANTTKDGNVYIGSRAGAEATLGEQNVYIGEATGLKTTTGKANVYIGNECGKANTSGSKNVFVGYKSGINNTTGSSNVLIGDSVGVSNNTGSQNIFIGNYAGLNNSGGYNNIYIGYEAGKNGGWASQNICIGDYAGMNNTSGQNLFVGLNSGKETTSGNRNTFIGWMAGQLNQTGSQNAYFGQFAGQDNLKSNNTFIGYWSGGKNTNGENNTFVGRRSGLESQGSNNVFLGHEAGYYNYGNGNVFIGYQAGMQTYNKSDMLYISNSNASTPLIYGDFSISRIGLGTTSPTSKLHIADTVSATDGISGAFVDIQNINGSTNNRMSGIRFKNYSSSTTNPKAALYFVTDNTYGRGNLIFALNNSADNSTVSTANAVLTINRTGLVGIGTTSPERPLHVNSSTSQPIALFRNTTAGNEGYISIQSNGSTGSVDRWDLIVSTTGAFRILEKNANAERFRIDAGGNVGIGKASPGYQLELSLNSAAKPSTNTWTISSDIRLKDVKGKYSKGLKEILLLDPIIYRYKQDNPLGIEETNTDAFGFSAQEVQKIFPEAVSTNIKGFLDFNIHPILIAEINAFKELHAKNEELQKIINQQSDEISNLKSRLEKLEKLFEQK